MVLQTKLLRAGARIPAQSRTHAAATEASNILMVSGQRSITGRPLFVGGPQIGYFFPGLIDEIGLHGPDIDVRGATSAPFPGYMLIGRNEDFAYTLTSAGADIIDTYAETLCGGSRLKYEYRGKCRDDGAHRRGHTHRGAARRSDDRLLPDRPRLGGRLRQGRAGASTVAIARKRSSYGKDTLDQLFFQDLTYKNRIRSFADFARSAAQTPQTFNSFYADATTAGMYTTGLLPLRPSGVDPGLPTDGRGGYEWKGYLADSQHPQGTVPNGLLVNWNNKPARNFVAGDDRFGNESMFPRVEHAAGRARAPQAAHARLGDRRDERGGDRGRPRRPALPPATRCSTRARRRARWPPRCAQQLQALGRAPARRGWTSTATATSTTPATRSWTRPGTDSPTRPCARAGRTLCDQLATRQSRFDSPNAPRASTAAGTTTWPRTSRTRSGTQVPQPLLDAATAAKGNVEVLRPPLWKALNAPASALAAQQGPDPSAWRENASTQTIQFSPLPLIRWPTPTARAGSSR